MRFWDSSALVQLYLDQGLQKFVNRLYREDGDVVVWWGTQVECLSAFLRYAREGGMTQADADRVIRRFGTQARRWSEIQPVPLVRDQAARMLRLYSLRAADALQLAAAWLAANQQPAELEFVSLDQRLRAAAAREGFPVPMATQNDLP